MKGGKTPVFLYGGAPDRAPALSRSAISVDNPPRRRAHAHSDPLALGSGLVRVSGSAPSRRSRARDAALLGRSLRRRARLGDARVPRRLGARARCTSRASSRATRGRRNRGTTTTRAPGTTITPCGTSRATSWKRPPLAPPPPPPPPRARPRGGLEIRGGNDRGRRGESGRRSARRIRRRSDLRPPPPPSSSSSSSSSEATSASADVAGKTTPLSPRALHVGHRRRSRGAPLGPVPDPRRWRRGFDPTESILGAAASGHTVAVTDAGALYTCGRNDSAGGGGHGSPPVDDAGQLGRGGRPDIFQRVRLFPPREAEANANANANADANADANAASGMILGGGSFSVEKERIVQASAGRYHTTALSASGRVYTFGLNDRGQLGRAGVAGTLARRGRACATAAGAAAARRQPTTTRRRRHAGVVVEGRGAMLRRPHVSRRNRPGGGFRRRARGEARDVHGVREVRHRGDARHGRGARVGARALRRGERRARRPRESRGASAGESARSRDAEVGGGARGGRVAGRRYESVPLGPRGRRGHRVRARGDPDRVGARLHVRHGVRRVRRGPLRRVRSERSASARARRGVPGGGARAGARRVPVPEELSG